MERIELPTSWPQTTRAACCATPRYWWIVLGSNQVVSQRRRDLQSRAVASAAHDPNAAYLSDAPRLQRQLQRSACFSLSHGYSFLVVPGGFEPPHPVVLLGRQVPNQWATSAQFALLRTSQYRCHAARQVLKEHSSFPRAGGAITTQSCKRPGSLRNPGLSFRLRWTGAYEVASMPGEWYAG